VAAALVQHYRGRVRRTYLRTRRVLARSRLLRRWVHSVRRRRHGRFVTPDAAPTPDAVLAPLSSPAARRQAVRRLLEPHLAAEGVPLARDDESPGAETAILTSAKRGLHRALVALAAGHPQLRVRIGVGGDMVETLRLPDLRLVDVASADWLQLGSDAEPGTYRTGVAGYLTVLFVAYDRARQRYLAVRPVAGRLDWTGLLPEGRVGRSTPPVAAPIDAVYTWVDPTDPDWRAAHDSHRGGDDPHIPSADNDERYVDRQELRYSLRALWRFAPFVRRIFLVTAGHRPPWLVDHPRVTVVSHEEIFPDPSVLPTFNSHAIEACLHRIPGLAGHFLYLNDDVFLGREVGGGDFFTTAGLAKVRLSPVRNIFTGRPAADAIPTDWAAYRSADLVERAAGMSFDRRLLHAPFALRTDVLRDMEERFGPEVARTRAARFRATTDVAVPSMLAPYYGIATARAVEWPVTRRDYLYLDTGRVDSLSRFDEILRCTPTFFCLNATRHTDVDLGVQARTLREFLSSAFPEPAPWERPASA
jgi:hypothetical protein